MRNLIICLYLFMNYLTILAQPDSTYLPFVAQWAPGTSHYFFVTEIEQRWEDNVLIKNDTFITMANLHVQNSNEEGFLVSLRQSFSPAEVGFEADPNVEFLESEIIYQIDSLGKFMTVRNWQEVSDRAVREIFKALNIESMSKEDSTRTIKAIEPMLTQLKTHEGVNAQLTEDIQMIHFPFGRAFSRVKTEHFETVLDVLGGSQVGAIGELYIDTVDQVNSICRVVQEIKINPEALTGFMHEFIEKMGVPADQIQNEIERTTLDVRKNLFYEYQFMLTIPSKISRINKFEVTLGNRTRMDKKYKVIQRIPMTEQASR